MKAIRSARLLFVAFAIVATRAVAADQPNILFVIADQ
jgi:hypothetical protein